MQPCRNAGRGSETSWYLVTKGLAEQREARLGGHLVTKELANQRGTQAPRSSLANIGPCRAIRSRGAV